GVRGGDSRALGEQAVEAGDLRRPDRAKQVGQPVVEPGGGQVVVPPAVVAETADRLGDTVVVGRDGAALPGRHDLARMEREARCETERAAGAAAAARAERTGGVLDDR